MLTGAVRAPPVRPETHRLRAARCRVGPLLLGDLDSREAVDAVGQVAPWARAPPPPPLLCAADASALLWSRAAGADSASVSLDLGRSSVDVSLSEDGATLALATRPVFLSWTALKEVAEDSNGCWQLLGQDGDDVLSRLIRFSGTTDRPVSLLPPANGRGYPTALIAGFAMHRFGRGVTPEEDTARKLSALLPLRPGARVLDICTGLGYTAIAAAERGCMVTTIELDEAMQELCGANPWSRLSAECTGSITQLRGDAAALLLALPDRSFDRIMHDPPSAALGATLFSAPFYAELARVLAPRGRLSHYTGDPESAHGARVAKGVVKRLKEAGFESAVADGYSHCVLAAHQDHVRPARPPAGRKAVDQRGYGMKGRRGQTGSGRARDKRHAIEEQDCEPFDGDEYE